LKGERAISHRKNCPIIGKVRKKRRRRGRGGGGGGRGRRRGRRRRGRRKEGKGSDFLIGFPFHFSLLWKVHH